MPRTAARQRAVLVGAALCTVGVIAIVLTSNREDANVATAYQRVDGGK